MRAVNAHLPADVVVREAAEVPQAFDANRDAMRKLYRYVIHDGPVPDLFLRRYCCHSRQPLDAAAMRAGGRAVCGAGTISAASRRNGPTACRACGPSRTWRLNRMGEWIWLDVEADGFLYNMVRAIAGTLMNVGRGYWPESQVADILEAEDRTQAGPDGAGAGTVPDARDL